MEVEKNSMLQCAHWYLENMKWSVIPVSRDKKPLIKWEEYQKRLPTTQEIDHWWERTPDANIGIVTGKISNLACIDIDDPEIKHDAISRIENFMKPPTCMTPRGGRHLYFKYPEGTELRNAVSIIPKVDIRGEGGYVVAPPSINGSGGSYKWLPGKQIDKITMVGFPVSIIDSTTRKRVSEEPDKNMFHEGRRDDDLFHIANIMVKGGARIEEIRSVLLNLAKTCSPPYPEGEISIKIESAMKRADRRDRNFADEVRRWIDIQDGYFELSRLYRDLNIQTSQDRDACYIAITRLAKDGKIEKYGKKSNSYRITDREVREMDWENAPTRDMNIVYPLGIERFLVTYPSNIFVIAGASNSGKTSFLLDFARLNCKRHEINYFNSEMGESELKMRLGLFQNCSIDDWKRVRFFERGSNFDDVIRPDKINIIDYLEVLNDFWMVGEQIRNIHNRLTTGIAVIAIQKNKGQELGRGGAFGTEKPRGYFSMDYGKMKIIKAKNWRTFDNPNGMITTFNISGGWRFVQKTDWHHEEEKTT
jgi:hypothetical protein